MPAHLKSLVEGPNILLDKPILLIGRHEECDIQLNSRKISRKHCCIAQVEEYFVVRDLGSTNGVRINGVRTQEGMLRVGDELTIGNYRYQVLGDGVMPDPPPQRARDEKTSPAAQINELESADEPVALEDEPDSPPAARRPIEGHRSGPPLAIGNDLPLAAPSSIRPPPPVV